MIVQVFAAVLALAASTASAVEQSCTNLCLQQPPCPSGTTSVSGTVFLPNGTTPLPNVLVYVPNAPVQPFTNGVSCTIPASGSPLVWTLSNADGSFTLPNMPAGADIPLVVQSGKWRRQVVVPNVASCTDTPLPVSLSRLPKNHSEGDIPRTAVLTSSADMPECVLRKVGIDDAEFTTPAGSGRINLYKGANGAAVSQVGPPVETDLFGNLATLNQYDTTILACQGAVTTTTQPERDNFLAYVNAGGRVFAADLEYRWLYNTAPFSSTANWSVEQADPVSQAVSINTSFPAGLRMAQWMQAVGGSTTFGQVSFASALHKDTNGVVPPSLAWLTIGNPSAVMQYSFDTPVGSQPSQQCGRVVYREMHSSNLSSAGNATFPAECSASNLSAEEKAFVFSLFDVTSFIQSPMPLTVTYNGNGATSGAPPVDNTQYPAGATATVLANTGNLVRTGFSFTGWSTASDGSGTSYAATGSATFVMGSLPVTLYAKWSPSPCSLDVDGNNFVDPLTDGLLLMRAMFGLTGDAVTLGALGANANRNTWEAIRSFLNTQCGGNFSP